VTTDFVWIRHEFPWIGDGFIHAVHTDAIATVIGHLRTMDFEFFEMNPTSGSVFDQLSDAFGFPDYFGRNWDAVNDCMGDIDPSMRSALVWRDADVSAATDPKLFAEACSTLMPSFDFWSQRGRQALLILVGSGTAFKRP
jgi:RNAse (barnase) inhibitor barstar